MYGTSAPISISSPNRYRDVQFSTSLAIGRINELVDQDIFIFYMKRHRELSHVVKQLRIGNIDAASIILKKQSRDMILPRYSICLLHAEILSICDFNSSYHSILGKIGACKTITANMKTIKDSKAICTSLLDSITLELHNVATRASPTGSWDLDSSANHFESLFWKYWNIDVECCTAELLLMQGILQVLLGRPLKGAVYQQLN